MYFCLLALKKNFTKIYVKETKFCEKVFFIRHGSKENVFFLEYSSRSLFFAKKTILKIKVTVFGVRKTFFFFLKGKKRPWYLCFVFQIK